MRYRLGRRDGRAGPADARRVGARVQAQDRRRAATRKESKHEIGGTTAYEHELTKNHAARNATESDGADDPENPSAVIASARARTVNAATRAVRALLHQGLGFPAGGHSAVRKGGITWRCSWAATASVALRGADKYWPEGCIISGQLGLTAVSGNFPSRRAGALQGRAAQHHRARIAMFVQFNIRTACAPSPSATTDSQRRWR